MPRGRHRHSPPLHRLLPPSAIAGVSVVCALGPWVFTETPVLRALAAAAAATAILGAVVMRHWDTQAGKRVADLTRARASDEWRYEERVAELESDLEESRELRGKLEQRLRAKRAELAKLRNEHASLLRRYATAETERASALEGRRLLEIEAVAPTPALPAARPTPAAQTPGRTPEAGDEAADEAAAARREAPAVFSPQGSRLFLRAGSALARLGGGGESAGDAGSEARGAGGAGGDAGGRAADRVDDDTDVQAADRAEGDGDGGDDGGGGGGRVADPAAEPAAEDEPRGQAAPEDAGAHDGPGTADSHERTAAPETNRSAQSAQSAQPAQPAPGTPGHFTVPTAVAVVPAAPPARRPVAEGGFDFFGNQTSGPSGHAEDTGALEAVQHEDLADVVGQEALALHKAEARAEAEAGCEAAGADARETGQVIDLTEHDETEQIDLEGLRSAVS
ncbi:hypothetical protein ABZ397_21395 [Streptomyces sp. NPDC005876]|uniref:hypothetical protein n=1 Tax=Streptomyces sp. NPDC005876 TaxID=3157076 RepID=UPI0033D709AD